MGQIGLLVLSDLEQRRGEAQVCFSVRYIFVYEFLLAPAFIPHKYIHGDLRTSEREIINKNVQGVS